MINAQAKIKARAELELRRRWTERLTDFETYLEYVNPDYDWQLLHLVYMRQYLDRIAAGETLKVMFCVPPQHGKSSHNTVRFTAYYMLTHSKAAVMLGAYNSEFASRFSRQIRELIKQRYRLDINQATQWTTAKGGSFKSGGVGSGLTGYAADLMVIDDPVKTPKDAYSPTLRKETWNWWQGVIKKRMHSKTSCLFTMTLWHPDDIGSRIIAEEGRDWIVIRIPALALDDDILGREPGEALWPGKFPKEFLEQQREDDPFMFEALSQQNPQLAAGNIIKRENLHYYDETPGRYDYVLQSWDTAFKAGQDNDYSACTTWACIDNKIYLIDLWRGKVDYPDLKKMFMIFANKWKPNIILVEDKASGQSLVQDLRRVSPYPILAIMPNGDKEYRVHLASDRITAGLVLFPGKFENNEVLLVYINELCGFPAVKNDDFVDSTTQALIYLNENYKISANRAKAQRHFAITSI